MARLGGTVWDMAASGDGGKQTEEEPTRGGDGGTVQPGEAPQSSEMDGKLQELEELFTLKTSSKASKDKAGANGKAKAVKSVLSLDRARNIEILARGLSCPIERLVAAVKHLFCCTSAGCHHLFACSLVHLHQVVITTAR